MQCFQRQIFYMWWLNSMWWEDSQQVRGYTNADILLYWEHGGVQEGWRWRGGGDWWALRAGALNKRVTLSSICLPHVSHTYANTPNRGAGAHKISQTDASDKHCSSKARNSIATKTPHFHWLEYWLQVKTSQDKIESRFRFRRRQSRWSNQVEQLLAIAQL